MTNKISLKQLRLFSFMAVLMLTAACKPPVDGPGETLLGSDLLVAFQNDTTPLSAWTELGDSINTSSSIYGNVMVGNYVDGSFGSVSTSAYMQLDLSTVQPRFPENIAIDSVVLSLAYFGRSYGNNALQYYKVQRLSEVVDSSRTYYSNDRFNTESENLILPGNEWVDPKPELVAGNLIGSAVPSLRIRLKNELGQYLLGLDPIVLDKFNHFKEYFRGIKISSATMDGQVVNYDISNQNTKLIVYYRDLDQAEPALQDYNFIFSSRCKAFTSIIQQYNNSPLSGLLSAPSIDGSSLCYAQSGGGTNVVVSLEQASWLKDIPNVIINKAELIVPYNNREKLSPITLLLARYKDSEGKFRVLSDDKLTLQVGGAVRVENGLYVMNITAHLQDYIQGKVPTDKIYLIPNAGILSTTRSILRGPAYSSTDRTQNMRLVITYSYKD